LVTSVAVRGVGCNKVRLRASYTGLMKFARLAAPLLVLAFIALGAVVLVMADVGTDVMLDVLHTSAGFN
jgi:hypothetical protein